MPPVWVQPFELEAINERARSASRIVPAIGYGLGSGGRDPDAASPAGPDGKCDCSGFLAWILGLDRKLLDPFYVRRNGGWFATDAIRDDALQAGGILELLPAPIAGCIVVFGRGAGVGHTGWWTSVPDRPWTGSRRDFAESTAIHCSLGNAKRAGNAIQETDGTAFYRPGDTVFCMLHR